VQLVVDDHEGGPESGAAEDQSPGVETPLVLRVKRHRSACPAIVDGAAGGLTDMGLDGVSLNVGSANH